MNVSLCGLLYLTASARTFSGLFDFDHDACKLQVGLGLNHVGFSIVDDYHIYVRDDDTKVTDLIQFL
jgi:hypothetical protein